VALGQRALEAAAGVQDALVEAVAQLGGQRLGLELLPRPPGRGALAVEQVLLAGADLVGDVSERRAEVGGAPGDAQQADG
jgi:hypothetical protein